MQQWIGEWEPGAKRPTRIRASEVDALTWSSLAPPLDRAVATVQWNGHLYRRHTDPDGEWFYPAEDGAA